MNEQDRNAIIELRKAKLKQNTMKRKLFTIVSLATVSFHDIMVWKNVTYAKLKPFQYKPDGNNKSSLKITKQCSQ